VASPLQVIQAMKPVLLFLLALSLGGPPDLPQRPDSTRAPRRPPASPTVREPSAERGKPPKAAKPTGEPQLKRRKPPSGKPD